jgi:tetratricopeptide (TPR) repeat protein
LFRQSNVIWKRIGALLPDAVTLSNQAQAHIYLENWNEAEELLEEADGMFDKVGTDDFTPEIERRWGELKFNTEDINSAKDHLTKSLNMAIEQKNQLEAAITERILGEVLLNQGDIDASEAILEESLRTLVDMESDYEAARTRVSLARLRTQQGKFEEARELLSPSVETFQQSGAEFELRKAKELLREIDKKI